MEDLIYFNALVNSVNLLWLVIQISEHLKKGDP